MAGVIHGFVVELLVFFGQVAPVFADASLDNFISRAVMLTFGLSDHSGGAALRPGGWVARWYLPRNNAV